MKLLWKHLPRSLNYHIKWITGCTKCSRHSKAFPVLSYHTHTTEDFIPGACLSHFPELFLVKLKCQKLFYQMPSLRNLAQPKEQLPISKVRSLNGGKFFFFYWYLKLAESKNENFIPAVSVSATDSYNHMQATIAFERLFKWTNTKKKEKHKYFHGECLPRSKSYKSQGPRSRYA